MGYSKDLSIIITTYNCDKYIKECLDSIFQQKNISQEKIEVLIIDDASTDNTRRILKSDFSDKVKMKFLKKHVGNQAKIKNLAIENADGKYIIFLDGDDKLQNDSLKTMVSYLGKNDLVLGKLTKFTANREIVPWDYKRDFMSNSSFNVNIEKFPDILGVMLTKCSGAIRTDFLKENNIFFDEELPLFCFESFIKKALLLASSFTYLNEPIYLYRVRNSLEDVSLTNKHSFYRAQDIRVMDNILFKFCVRHNKVHLYNKLNYIHTRNAIYSFDYDFNKLPEVDKEAHALLFKELFERTKEYNTNTFNKNNMILIDLISNNQVKECVSLLCVRISRSYYEEQNKKMKPSINLYHKLLNSKSWKYTSIFRKTTQKLKNYRELIAKNFLLFLYYVTRPYFKNKEIWLIGERPDQAEDNSYHLFKYIRENHPEREIFYIINKQSDQLQKVEKLGNVVYHTGWRHKLLMLNAEMYISAYHFYSLCFPAPHKKFKEQFEKYIKAKTVFLQHGVYIHDVRDWTFREKDPYDLIITSSNYERRYVIEELGYKKHEVVNTGLCRFDNLHDFKTKKEILIMPTWRKFLKYQSPKQFVFSEYYQRYNNLINNESFKKLIKDNHLKVNFYVHSEMQKFISLFNFDNDYVNVIKKGEESVQDLLKNCSMLITDYSSVAADICYMDKPAIMYQFDPEKFHYYPSEYIHYSDVADVVSTESELLDKIEYYISSNFTLNQARKRKAREIFNIRDTNNNKRVYDSICKLTD
ncbi:CDP-glycerol glycerophosphotransferase family protein [Bacillus inaquosorum]|uniref:bifunctional glycosyltransferase/CDP-glycerol:glycerophosphate glycerophosphotransferase n=1 Tax=Bacillus inaquosorum TaxID=483913 RepID=UPI002280156B|nr:CDP-glycerol glycerophosphotransferase family protein [Bacillus inaquosorum]MCY8695798.1 CDP-glycerol:glycerophosphate glycerophosphotransferase [Bacillus inaquosorum]